MALLTKPNMQQVWASGGDIVEPSDLKKQQGWTVEVPPHQFENWIQNRQDEYLAHINQRGIPAWDGLTNYEAGGLSYVQGSDGKVYKSVAASGPDSIVSNPTTDVTDTYWTVAFLIQTDGDSRYTQRANNLSDVTNVTTARTNLAVYSKVETDTRNLNSVRIDIASASNINLTTSAPNTRHINITGTTTINSFTVVAGVAYFVRFNAALTLVNSASLVTQTGANILTAAGDTCIIRATAANVIEVLSGKFLADRGIGSGQEWVNVGASRTSGTIYTNTTGRTIFVIVQGDTAALTAVVGGETIVANESGNDAAYFPVQHGKTYSVTVANIFSWRELR